VPSEVSGILVEQLFAKDDLVLVAAFIIVAKEVQVCRCRSNKKR
jgi:hypothetical protein